MGMLMGPQGNYFEMGTMKAVAMARVTRMLLYGRMRVGVCCSA